jgi:hypothetical protein
VDKRRSEAVEKSERAATALWHADMEGVRTTGECTSPLEILLVEDDTRDTILIHEIMGERPGSQV